MKRRTFLKSTAGAGLAAGFPVHLYGQTKMHTRVIQSTDTEIGIVGLGNSRVFNNSDQDSRGTSSEILAVLQDSGGHLVDATRTAVQNFASWFDHDELSDLHLTSGFEAGSSTFTRDVMPEVNQALGKDRFDCLYLRNMSSAEAFIDSGKWTQLKEMRAEGLVKHIGITGTRTGHYAAMEAAINDGADFIQIAYNFFERMAEDRILPAARDNGVAVVTSRPFINGNYFPRVSEHTLPDWAGEFDCASWAQFSIKWIVGNPVITCVMTETTKPHHAKDNMQGGAGVIPDQAMRDRILTHIQSIT